MDFCGFDIISLYSFINNKTYKTSVNDLYNLISDLNLSKNINKLKNEDKGIIIKESQIITPNLLNPLQILTSFHVLPHYYLPYINKFCYNELFLVNFIIDSNYDINVYFSYFRNTTNGKIELLPLFPKQPFPLFNDNLINDKTEIIVFEGSELYAKFYQENLNLNSSMELVFISAPNGFQNLLNIDINRLKNKFFILDLTKGNYIYEFNKYIDFNDLIKFSRSNSIEIYLLIHDTNISWYSCVPLNLCIEKYDIYIRIFPNLANTTSSININTSLTYKYELSGFTDKGELPKNYDKQAVKIIDPIIEKGNIIWCFSPPKVGKTILGILFAYAVSKGNCTIGDWLITDKFNVFYIDGEMSDSKFTQLFLMIAHGFNDYEINKYPFQRFSLFESEDNYSGIMDETWLKTYDKVIDNNDLIIIDNYYSLNRNNLSIESIYKWMKSKCRLGISFLVLDHTNRDGILQGSVDKLRICDLSIQLSPINDDIFEIKYDEDRHGRKKKLKYNTFRKYFSDDGTIFKLEPVETGEDIDGIHIVLPKITDEIIFYSLLNALISKFKNKNQLINSLKYDHHKIYNFGKFMDNKTDSFKNFSSQADKDLIIDYSKQFIGLEKDEILSKMKGFEFYNTLL
jgi:hypothetical protein